MDAKEQNRIDTAIHSRDQNIRLSAMYRDAALFTAARLGTWKQAEAKNFTEEHRQWIEYFHKLYFPTKSQ